MPKYPELDFRKQWIDLRCAMLRFHNEGVTCLTPLEVIEYMTNIQRVEIANTNIRQFFVESHVA